jgi:fatty-acyl-CoA synthase
MNNYTMDYQLTLLAIMKRAETLYRAREIVSEPTPCPSAAGAPPARLQRYTYADMVDRAKRLAIALQSLGIRPGDRVGTLSWNHHQHLEAYFGITSCGAVLHTLNLRLHPQELAYIINHAGDKVVFVDADLVPLLNKVRDELRVAQLIVISPDGKPVPRYTEFEQFLAGADLGRFQYPELNENQPAAMCYTSGTTGKPKGAVYSHRALVLHSMGMALADTLAICEADVVLPVVPMFHVNAWCLPLVCTMVGAKQVLTGPHYDVERLLKLLQDEKVTYTSGVPTIWLGVLQYLDAHPGAFDLSRIRAIAVGGSAVPRSMIEAFQERHGLKIVQAWGMTEMSPLGTVGNLPSDLRQVSKTEQYDYRAKQGTPVPFIEIRARGADGLVPWDGKSVGELEVRGAWVIKQYYDCPEGACSFTGDGWFRTGDIVSIDPGGCIQITDRSKDVIKSGGEWISSVALENALMGHPAVAEAAVIGVLHEKWQERPLAVVVLKKGQSASADELSRYLERTFPRWWLPDAVIFTDQIPRTTAGKFLKKALREQYQSYLTTAGK